MMIRDFRRRFWISLVITAPVLLLSPMIQQLIGYQLDVPYQRVILFVLSTIIFFYGGWPFLTGLIDELRQRQPGMMTLIAVAVTVAWGYSSATTFGVEGSTFFWELATLIDIMLLGHWIEMKSVMGASRSLQKLVEMLPSKAHLLDKDGNTRDVELEKVKVNDHVKVFPGDKIPVDGVVTRGESRVNESMVTGESLPVNKKMDDKVIGGTLNENGSLVVSVEKTGDESYLNKVIHMVREAQEKKSRSQRLADRIAFWLTLLALGVGFGTLVTWLILGQPFVFALERMASVMVITCPHALGLAIPLVAAISTSVSASNGLLIRNRTAFENARKITTLVFDKTGTLTHGNFGVIDMGVVEQDDSTERMMRIAGALEQNSEHPLAAGIVKKVKEMGLELPSAEEFNNIPGMGVEGTVDKRSVKVVGPRYLAENQVEQDLPYKRKGYETIVFVLEEEKLIGFIVLADRIREESFQAVKQLRDNGLKVYMLTGDNREVAEGVSRELGLDGFEAGVLPGDKKDRIQAYRDKGEFVAMTGDGVNDAPALATADVGIAVGSGTEVAGETADIVLVRSNPVDIAALIMFGKATYRKMIQNFIWATGYNVVAIPLAAGVLYSAGILISPAAGAVLMSLSTVIVALNAQLLRRQLKQFA